MEKELPIKFKSIDIMWLFSVDLLNRIENMKEFNENLNSLKYRIGSLRPLKPEERRHGDKCEIEINDQVETTNKKEYEDLLKLLCKTDHDIFTLEYLENDQFSRFLFKSIKLRFPFSEKFFECKIIFTVSQLGIGVISFWVHINEELDSYQIAKLKHYPLSNERIFVEISKELLEEIAEIEDTYIERKIKVLKENRTSDVLKPGPIKVPFHLHWSTLINVISNRDYESSGLEFMEKNKLRLEVNYVFPIVIINSTDPEVTYPEKLIENYPKQIYQILSELHDLDYNLIYDNILNDFLTPNITNRHDVAYLDSPNSNLLIFSPEAINERQKLTLEVFAINEILIIQRHYLRYFSMKLKDPIEDMSPKQIFILRSHLSKALDAHFGYVVGNSLARKRFKHGQDIFEIDEVFKMVDKKIELLAEAFDSYSALKTNFYQIAIALILGLLPFIYYAIPLDNQFINSLIVFFIAIGIILGFYAYSRWKWLHLRKKEA